MKKQDPKLIIYEILIALLFFVLITVLAGRFYQRAHQEETTEEAVNETKEIDFSKINVISGKYYYSDEHYDSSFGIDVSEFQDDIDWKKVAADKVEFAFIRIGRRGATTGLLYEDEKFLANYNGAKENNLKVGVYFFSQAINEKEANEEAEWVIEHLQGKDINFPIVYDCEEVFLEDEEARIMSVDKQQITANVLSFMNRLKKDGYEGMIYTYPYWADELYDMEQLQDYPIWLAVYDTSEPVFSHPFQIWQYSNKGSINGISEPTDLNIMFIPKEA